MIYTIVAALVVAVAAIGGMLFFSRWMMKYQAALRQHEVAQVGIIREYDEKVGFLQHELFRAKQASSVRDPKTGRFISAEEKLHQRMKDYREHALAQRSVVVTADNDVAGLRFEQTVPWSR